MKDLIKESTWDTRKFGEALPTMEDYKTAYNKKHNITEADPPQPPAGGEEKPPEPQKLKIDIPDSPFEPDVNQIKDRLKQILKQWKIAGKSNAGDIIKLINYLDGEK